MPVLVGDVIMAVRSLIPDTPGVLPPPVGITLSQQTGLSTPFAAGNWYAWATVTTPWGEGIPVQLTGSPYNLTAGAGLVIDNATHTMPFGASTLRVYFSNNSTGGSYPQANNQYVDITVLPTVITNPGTPGLAPSVNRAWMPDTDGKIFPAYTLYGWLREALNQAADITGGIYDATGVNTTIGYAMYQLLGQWKKMSHGWVDGWPFAMGNKGEVYYRNKVTTSGSGIAVLDTRGVQSMIEYYPVPSRSGASTLTIGTIGATSTSIPLVDTSSFLLQYGLALIGNEIVAYQAYNGSTNTLLGCLRGLSGTVPFAWPSNTAVFELNGRFAGYRYPTLPQVGMALSTLDVPPTWDSMIQLYMESKYRTAERRFKEATDMMKAFQSGCKMLKSANDSILGPKQVGETQTNEVYNAGLGGGWLLP